MNTLGPVHLEGMVRSKCSPGLYQAAPFKHPGAKLSGEKLRSGCIGLAHVPWYWLPVWDRLAVCRHPCLDHVCARAETVGGHAAEVLVVFVKVEGLCGLHRLTVCRDEGKDRSTETIQTVML